ncbi:MAG: dephospho-CoA kinase [Lacipirellulaceae bacterium]
MIVLGLTGGIASGKSFVAGLLAERGAVLLDADQHAHAVLAEPGVVGALVDRWGVQVLDEAGAVRRGEVARRVFGDGAEALAERQFLEGLVHPRVRELLRAELDAARLAEAPAAVLDVPLLYESGWDRECDAVLFVDTPGEVRRERARRRGWTDEAFSQREGAQTPIDEKRRRADFVVPGGAPEEASQAVEAAWRRFVVGGAG